MLHCPYVNNLLDCNLNFCFLTPTWISAINITLHSSSKHALIFLSFFFTAMKIHVIKYCDKVTGYVDISKQLRLLVCQTFGIRLSQTTRICDIFLLSAWLQDNTSRLLLFLKCRNLFVGWFILDSFAIVLFHLQLDIQHNLLNCLFNPTKLANK